MTGGEWDVTGPPVDPYVTKEPQMTAEERDRLGRMVRVAWVKWAKTHPSPKASWLAPYDDLGEMDKEADRQIGETIWEAARAEERAACFQIANEMPHGGSSAARFIAGKIAAAIRSRTSS